jgi:large subunit ribosomal protein L32
MAVPKRRTSRCKKGLRRSHDHLSNTESIACPACGEQTLPHRICPHCGEYKGRAYREEVAEE